MKKTIDEMSEKEVIKIIETISGIMSESKRKFDKTNNYTKDHIDEYREDTIRRAKKLIALTQRLIEINKTKKD